LISGSSSHVRRANSAIPNGLYLKHSKRASNCSGDNFSILLASGVVSIEVYCINLL